MRQNRIWPYSKSPCIIVNVTVIVRLAAPLSLSRKLVFVVFEDCLDLDMSERKVLNVSYLNYIFLLWLQIAILDAKLRAGGFQYFILSFLSRVR